MTQEYLSNKNVKCRGCEEPLMNGQEVKRLGRNFFHKNKNKDCSRLYKQKPKKKYIESVYVYCFYCKKTIQEPEKYVTWNGLVIHDDRIKRCFNKMQNRLESNKKYNKLAQNNPTPF